RGCKIRLQPHSHRSGARTRNPLRVETNEMNVSEIEGVVGLCSRCEAPAFSASGEIEDGKERCGSRIGGGSLLVIAVGGPDRRVAQHGGIDVEDTRLKFRVQ